ncbi:hypothetical protein ASE04_05550 [Rhizobium sp. Root708]|nr:hypothetical protein ASE04_05550 [Rhizobium sp. Root708]
MDVRPPGTTIGCKLDGFDQFEIKDRLLKDAQCARNAASESPWIAGHEQDGHIRLRQCSPDDRAGGSTLEIHVDKCHVHVIGEQQGLIHIAGDANSVVPKFLDGILQIESDQRLIFYY